MASNPAERIICNNSDYVIRFDFDEEWEAHPIKTARFLHGGTHTDVAFKGTECPVPILNDVAMCAVGVYSADLKTTTPALISCERSILCEDEPEAESREILIPASLLDEKQDKLTAGDGIAIDQNNIISAIGGGNDWKDLGIVEDPEAVMDSLVEEGKYRFCDDSDITWSFTVTAPKPDFIGQMYWSTEEGIEVISIRSAFFDGNEWVFNTWNTLVPYTALNAYASKSYVNNAVKGYATESYVNSAISNAMGGIDTLLGSGVFE